MSRDYILTRGAASDLSEIIRHTNEQWGETQCMTYIGQLEKTAIAVAKGEGAFKDLSAIHPQLRMARCGKHYIFCLPRQNDLSIILAVFHERMDIMERLRSRLI